MFMEIVRLPKVNLRRVMPAARQSSMPAAQQPTEQSQRRQHLRLINGGTAMSAHASGEFVLTAPDQLSSATRAEFRQQAIALVERASLARAREIAVDLSRTNDVDASGLGILVLIQKKAKDVGLGMRLARATPAVRHLLQLTKLDHLFEFVD